MSDTNGHVTITFLLPWELFCKGQGAMSAVVSQHVSPEKVTTKRTRSVVTLNLQQFPVTVCKPHEQTPVKRKIFWFTFCNKQKNPENLGIKSPSAVKFLNLQLPSIEKCYHVGTFILSAAFRKVKTVAASEKATTCFHALSVRLIWRPHSLLVKPVRRARAMVCNQQNHPPAIPQA